MIQFPKRSIVNVQKQYAIVVLSHLWIIIVIIPGALILFVHSLTGNNPPLLFGFRTFDEEFVARIP